MSEDQKAIVVAATGYKPPAWIKFLIVIAQTCKWVGGLSAAGGVASGAMNTKWGIIIFGAAYGVGKIVELAGDFFDDQKFNDSFKELLKNNP